MSEKTKNYMPKLLKEKTSEIWEKFKNSKFAKQVPNIITWVRIGASIAAPICFLSGHPGGAVWLWIGGAASDAIDGFAARKLDAITEFGRKLDAVSDKIFALSILAPSIISGNFFMLVPLVFEARISHINLKGQKLGFEPQTTKVGKRKTIVLFPTIILSVLSLSSPALYWVLFPMLGFTTYLQAKTFKEYKEYFDQKLAEQATVHPDAQETLSAEKPNTAKKSANSVLPLTPPQKTECNFKVAPRGPTCPPQARPPGSLSRALTPQQKNNNNNC